MGEKEPNMLGTSRTRKAAMDNRRPVTLHWNVINNRGLINLAIGVAIRLVHHAESNASQKWHPVNWEHTYWNELAPNHAETTVDDGRKSEHLAEILVKPFPDKYDNFESCLQKVKAYEETVHNTRLNSHRERVFQCMWTYIVWIGCCTHMCIVRIETPSCVKSPDLWISHELLSPALTDPAARTIDRIPRAENNHRLQSLDYLNMDWV